MPLGNVRGCENAALLRCLTEGKFSLGEPQMGCVVPGKYFDQY